MSCAAKYKKLFLSLENCFFENLDWFCLFFHFEISIPRNVRNIFLEKYKKAFQSKFFYFSSFGPESVLVSHYSWKECNQKSATKKTCDMKKVQHEKSATWEKCKMEIVQY